MPIVGSTDKLTTFATEALGLEVSKFVEINPQDLSQYGLDQPQYTITLQTAAGDLILRIGKAADDSSYYMMSDAMPVVFTAAKDSFTTIDMPTG